MQAKPALSTPHAPAQILKRTRAHSHTQHPGWAVTVPKEKGGRFESLAETLAKLSRLSRSQFPYL